MATKQWTWEDVQQARTERAQENEQKMSALHRAAMLLRRLNIIGEIVAEAQADDLAERKLEPHLVAAALAEHEERIDEVVAAMLPPTPQPPKLAEATVERIAPGVHVVHGVASIFVKPSVLPKSGTCGAHPGHGVAGTCELRQGHKGEHRQNGYVWPAQQPEEAKQARPATCPHCGHFDHAGSVCQRVVLDDPCNCTLQPATPPSPEPAGEVMDALNAVPLSAWSNARGKETAFAAARADQRAAVEAACAPLRGRVRKLGAWVKRQAEENDSLALWNSRLRREANEARRRIGELESALDVSRLGFVKECQRATDAEAALARAQTPLTIREAEDIAERCTGKDTCVLAGAEAQRAKGGKAAKG